jgi:hypothetical protein
MNIGVLIPLLVTTLVAIVGWYAGHYFSSIRDRRQKLVDLRAEYLLNIYRRLERSVGKEVTREMADDIETALADLQVLGNSTQVDMARQYIKEWGGRDLGGINVGVLLEDIRNSVRVDLGLEPVSGPVDHFRLHLAPPAPGVKDTA